MRALLVVALACVSASAEADPVYRFGMTFGADHNAPEATEVGPKFGIGLNSGRFTGEANYAYLSFFDPNTSIHRFGVALRMDLFREYRIAHRRYSRALFTELGTARRMGHWQVNRMDSTTSQNELHASLGFELDHARGAAWQLALRFGMSRRDPLLGIACRGITCPVAMPESTGVASSLMLEWMFMLGR